MTTITTTPGSGAPELTRTRYEETSKPGLNATWAAPSSDTNIDGYEVYYCKHGETQWSARSPLAESNVTLEGLEEYTSYRVLARALQADNRPLGGWSDTGSGRTNRPTDVVAPYPHTMNVDWGSHGLSRLYGYHEDADGDTLTFTVRAKNPGIVEPSIQEEEDGTYLKVLARNPGVVPSSVEHWVDDGYGGRVGANILVEVVANEARYVAENSPAGTAVGSPVTGKPYDDGDDTTDDSLTYTLTDGTNGDVTGPFVIDSASGQISVKPVPNLNDGANPPRLDHETKDSYTGQCISPCRARPP